MTPQLFQPAGQVAAVVAAGMAHKKVLTAAKTQAAAAVELVEQQAGAVPHKLVETGVQEL